MPDDTKEDEMGERLKVTLEIFEDGTGRIESANGSSWDLDREEVARLRDKMDESGAVS